MNSEPPSPEFNAYARNYDGELNQGLCLTGEKKEYFAQARIEFTRSLIGGQWPEKGRVVDFGCGTGTALPFLLTTFQVQVLAGYDPSPESIQEARQLHGTSPAHFGTIEEILLRGPFDLVYCNGVFHHIPREDRAEALRQVRQLCRPGGWFALWENNPWNPLTRLIMSRVAFDRDAILLTPGETRQLLREAGFTVVCTRYLFIFPNALRFLRFIEPQVSGLPLGGQYLVLAQAPA